MGYPIEMINKDTSLYALIGQNAIESKQEAIFNDFFKLLDVNAKMMPLNIRADDIGFFIHGLRESQIKAAYFQKEYWTTLFELLEDMSEEAKICGICDMITVKNKTNKAGLIQGEAAVALLNAKDKVIAIYGNTPSVKSILYHLVKQNPKEIILYDDVVENCIELMKLIPNNIKVDIERVHDKNIFIKNADIFIDALVNKNFQFNTTVQTILELTYQKSEHLNFNDIEIEIANILTKEWTQHG